MLSEFRSTNVTWDKATSRIYSPVTANESDENGRKLVVQIVNGGQVEDLTGASLHLYWETRDKLHDGLDVFKSVDLKKGKFELSYTTGMLSNKGVLKAHLVLVDTTGRVVSERFNITVKEGIDNDAIQSENSFTSLTQALIEVGPRLNSLTEQLQQTNQRINNIITTPVPPNEFFAQEIIDARQGAISVGANITGIKSQIVEIDLKNNKRITRENLFNKSTIIPQAIVGNEGVITPLEGFDASDFIYVGGLPEIKLSLTHIVRGFDRNKNYVLDFPVMDSLEADQLVTIPAGVYYIRFSTFNWATPTAQVGVNVDRTQYRTFGKYYADNLVKINEVLVSKTSTNPEAYSVFTEAIIKNRDIPNTVITVEAGEYDVYSELVGVYGQSFFDNHTENTTDGWGLEIGNNITIKGSPNAKLRFNYPGGNTSVLGKFALLMLKNSDVKIEGVQLLASNCKYVVHDDWYEKTKPYSHNYKDVKMIMDNTNNPLGNNFRCIGGGVGNEGHVNIDGCIFKAIGSSAEKHLISYHNASGANAQSRITIVNNYFEDTGSIRLGYYGPSTLLTDVLITSNSYYKDVDVVSEDGITTNNNFNILKFGNEIRG